MDETQSPQTADDLIVSVRLFARARELAGVDVVQVSVPQLVTIGELRAALARQHPQLTPISGALLFAVNATYAGDADPVPRDAELACFPPVSGG